MSQSRSIVKQASILAIAGILVRIIGLLYRSPLVAIIGAEGNGYYSTAYNIYALILLISSYSIPTAISKLISEKLVLNQYNNVQKILKCSFIYICAIGGGAALVTFLLAPFIVTEHAVLSLRILCPTIFLAGLLGVLRGYFQAHQTTFYTSVSQIVEQVFNAVVSVGAAYLFIQPFLDADHSIMASFGAAGSSLGTGIGVLIGLGYMAFMYMRRKNNLIVRNDPDEHEDSYKEIFRMILSIVTPIIIATCIYNLVSTIDMYIYYFAAGVQGLSSVQAATQWGVYGGEFIVLQNVPIALASAMSAASIPAISSSFTIKNFKETKAHINSSIRITMMILMPSAFGMAILAFPIIGTIFPQEETMTMATLLLIIGSPGILFFGLSTLSNGILQAIGEASIPLKNATIALVWHCILVVVLLFLTPLGLYALAIANTLYAVQVCYLNQRALHQKLHYKQEIRRTYILPLIASLLMGLVVGVTYFGLFAFTHKVFIPMVIAVIVGIITYFAVILYFYADNPEGLSEIPYMNKIIYKLKRRS